MSKTCPSCGSPVQAEARFCRRCGAPLRRGATTEGSPETVSPMAATVPLSDEGRTTDGFAPDDPLRPAADTTRVNRAELDALLRKRPMSAQVPEANAGFAPPPAAPDNGEGDSPRAAQTSELEATLITTAGEASRGAAPHADEDDGELTISVPSGVRPFGTDDAGGVPQMVEPLGAAGLHNVPAEQTGVQAGETPAPAAAAAPPRNNWKLVAGICAALLLVAVVAGALFAFWFRPAPPAETASTPPVLPSNDVRARFDEKVAEAESLLSRGDIDGALAALREANRLMPANVKAHQRLGEILLENGARREAIEEFRAVTRNNPEDFTAWRALASAQLAEGLYDDAIKSYQTLLALTRNQSPDANDMLSYAEALRLAGRVDEARLAYARLTSNIGDAGALARQRLAELAQATPTPAPSPRENETASARTSQAEESGATSAAANPTPANAAAQPTPTQAPTPVPDQVPADPFKRGTELWASNRTAAVAAFQTAARSGNPDAHYYLGLSYVEGKDLRTLKRAELIAALEHFQVAAQRGNYTAQSRRYAQQLEKEFDRLRKQ